MANKLPDKLTSLRKYYGYSQSEIADRLNIQLMEYMGWENGSRIPTIYQMKMISALFQVSLDEMLDNTKTVTVTPRVDTKIEFSDAPDSEKTQDLTTGEYNAMGVSTLTNDDDLAKTRRMDSMQFSATTANRIVDDGATRVDMEAVEEEEEEQPHNSNKRNSIIIALVALLAIAIVAGAILLLSDRSGGVDNSITDINRLAAGNYFSVYLDRRGDLVKSGTVNTNGFEDVVQISAYDSRLVGLTKKGTIVSNDGSGSGMKDMVMTAAGKNHTVGLKKDGTVSCSGSVAACAVDTWKDIKAVYAGNEVTVGVGNDGSVYVSPATVVASRVSNVKDCAIGDNMIVFAKNDGTAQGFKLDTLQELDLSSWSNIQYVAAGSSIVAGLRGDGTVALYTLNEEEGYSTANWVDIRYIDINGDTLVGMSGAGRFVGIGPNNGQYSADAVEETPEPSEEPEKLAQVTNIEFSETTANIVIRWNEVENAEYYEVEIDTDPVTKVSNIGNNSMSVAANTLKDGQTYLVRVIAFAEGFEQSDPAEVTYKYLQATIQLAQVQNIQAQGEENFWNVTWDAVDHANYYLVSYDGFDDQRTDTNSIRLDLTEYAPVNGSIHNLSIVAVSEDTKYIQSEPTKVTYTYEYEVKRYTVSISFSSTDGTVIDSINTMNMQLEEGTYNMSDFVPEGYRVTDEQYNEFTVTSDLTMQIFISPISQENSGEENPGGGEEGGENNNG